MGHEVKVGEAVFTLKFTILALRTAQQKLGRPVRDVVQNMDINEVCELTACALLHNGSKATAKTVEGWLERYPECFLPLMEGLALEIADAYKRLLPQKKDPTE